MTSRGHNHCWAEDPTGRHRCTLDTGHPGDHHDWYAPRDLRDWPAKPKPDPDR